MVNDSRWLDREMLEVFQSIITSYQSGEIDDETLKDRLFKLNDRIARNWAPETIK